MANGCFNNNPMVCRGNKIRKCLCKTRYCEACMNNVKKLGCHRCEAMFAPSRKEQEHRYYGRYH